ncbi:MAG: hypothetical protein NWE95_01870 [Candidatus Bathyarchaeota archaeon]|nr:hypothetical protein [Candidatus Bathyarchaeota archaeon]
MRGYCAKCQEFRSDDGIDAWRILWNDDLPVCEKCGSVVDVWRDEEGNCEILNRILDKEPHDSAGKNGEGR